MNDADTHKHTHARPPDKLTKACWLFFHEHSRLIGFIMFVVELALRADEVRKTAAQALLNTARDEEERTQQRASLDEGDVVTRQLRRFRQLIFQIAICRAVDNFLSYVSHLLAEIFRTRPETLRSGETVRLDTILRHGTMTDLIEDLAEQRVHQLSYQGMRDLQGYLSDRLGFDLFWRSEDAERAVRLVETRNLIVHNRAVVNRLFLSRLQGFPRAVGDRLIFEFDEVFEDIEFLAWQVAEVDRRAIEKYGLGTKGWQNYVQEHWSEVYEPWEPR